MTCFAPSLVKTGAAAQDPTKHVNYVLGMILGVEDLTQEFGYLSQRDQWIVRDLAGYGTIWGLAVSIRDPTPRGPEVTIAPGVAANPRGQLIRVAPAQCAALNDWLKPRGADILARRIPTGNPNLFQLPVHVVLSYRTCLTDPVPIAGEPCRSEDDYTAPSRAADDYLLELRFDPPPQQEEDSVRELVQWLRSHVSVTGGGTASLTIPQFLDAMRTAARNAQQAVSSPPSSPPAGAQFMLDSSPPVMLSVPRSLLGDYVRAIARLYVTELRPLWRPNWLGQKHGCAGSDLLSAPEEGNAVLLARLTLTIGPDGLNAGAWVVQGPVAIDERTRPFLLQTRMLQELLLAGDGGGGGGGGFGGGQLVAAGIVNANGAATTRAVLNSLRVSKVVAAGPASKLFITFDGYTVPPVNGAPQLVLKALPWSPLLNLTATFAGFDPDGMVLALSKAGAALSLLELNATQIVAEVTRIG